MRSLIRIVTAPWDVADDVVAGPALGGERRDVVGFDREIDGDADRAIRSYGMRPGSSSDDRSMWVVSLASHVPMRRRPIRYSRWPGPLSTAVT